MRIRLTPEDRRVVDVAREQRMVMGDWKWSFQVVTIGFCAMGVALAVLGAGAYWLISLVRGWLS